ncbi:hypothetical protein ACFXKR_16330 [Streptomyces violascens]|uniref:hypothetical protein n=1 Tax=Streptomyces violascens TaxID=67381 RepID=UPI0036C9155D
MGTGEQLVTIAAVLLGALTTHVTNHLMERNRMKYQLTTRWDDKKLDAYDGYVDRVRSCIFLAVQLYETKEGLREREQPDAEILAEMKEAGHLRGHAFERVMLLGGDGVVEAAHDLNAAVAQVDWQANGKNRRNPGGLARPQPCRLPLGQLVPRSRSCGPGCQRQRDRRTAPGARPPASASSLRLMT